MEKYTVEIFSGVRYRAEIVAEDRLHALDIADNINPAEDDRCSFLEVAREVTEEDVQTITQAMDEQTPYYWDIVPTGGGCHAIETELHYGVIRISTAEAQAPTHGDDVVNVVYSTTDNDTHLMTCKAHELFTPHTCGVIVQLAQTEENRKRICPKCGQHETDCVNSSRGTAQMINAIRELMHYVSVENRQHLSDLIDGYTTHAIPECNEASQS